MPHGKPAGVACVQLDPDLRCKLFGLPARPPVCVSLRPSQDLCRDNAHSAFLSLIQLEKKTAPTDSSGIP